MGQPPLKILIAYHGRKENFMRRMTNFWAFIKKLAGLIGFTGNKIEVGNDLEVDGNFIANGSNQYAHYLLLEITTGSNKFRATFTIYNEHATAYPNTNDGYTALLNYLKSLRAGKGSTFRIPVSGAYTIGGNVAITSHMDIKPNELDLYGINIDGTSASAFRFDNLVPTLYDDVVKLV